MPRRKANIVNDTQIIFRVPASLKCEIDAMADASKLSTAEWLRKAVVEKLSRDRNSAKKQYIMTEEDLKLFLKENYGIIQHDVTGTQTIHLK